jgi:hypothetical protein
MRPDLSLLEYPWMLLLAVLLPAALVVLLYRARRQRVQRLARLGALDVVRRLVPATTFDGSGWRATRLALAAGCAGLDSSARSRRSAASVP